MQHDLAYSSSGQETGSEEPQEGHLAVGVTYSLAKAFVLPADLDPQRAARVKLPPLLAGRQGCCISRCLGRTGHAP